MHLRVFVLCVCLLMQVLWKTTRDQNIEIQFVCQTVYLTLMFICRTSSASVFISWGERTKWKESRVSHNMKKFKSLPKEGEINHFMLLNISCNVFYWYHWALKNGSVFRNWLIMIKWHFRRIIFVFVGLYVLLTSVTSWIYDTGFLSHITLLGIQVPAGMGFMVVRWKHVGLKPKHWWTTTVFFNLLLSSGKEKTSRARKRLVVVKQ